MATVLESANRWGNVLALGVGNHYGLGGETFWPCLGKHYGPGWGKVLALPWGIIMALTGESFWPLTHHGAVC
jgi:hypothetical protein